MHARLENPRQLNRLTLVATLLFATGCSAPEPPVANAVAASAASSAGPGAQNSAELAAELGAEPDAGLPADTSAAAPVPADGEPASNPERGAERLRIIPPNGWVLVASSNQGELRKARYLREPDAKVIESLTLEAFSAIDQADPLTFLDGLATNEADRCDGFTRQPTFAGEERGAEVAVELHRCPRRPVNGQATVSLIKVIQGQELYVVLTLTKEARAKSSADGWKTDFVDESDVARWALYLKSAYLEPAAP